MECKIYKNQKDLLKAIKKSPKNSIIVFDEADLFSEHIEKIRAKTYKDMLKKIIALIDLYRSPRGYGYHIKADMIWGKLRKQMEKKAHKRN